MLSTEWLNAFVPVGVIKDGNLWITFGAGVLVFREPYLWIVTANHVVEQIGATGACVLVNGQDGNDTFVVQLDEIHKAHDLKWVSSKNYDLAASIMIVDPAFRIKAVSVDNFLKLSDVMPSMQCYMIGCVYGFQHAEETVVSPMVLDGVVSGKEAHSKTIYTSTPIFSGNSGGPLIVVRSAFDSDGRMVTGRWTICLAGVMLGTQIVPSAGNLNERPTFQLGIARAADAILELFETDDAREQTERLLSVIDGRRME